MANIAVLSGRLTKEVDLRYLQGSNNAVARFTIAVDKNLSRDKRQELESKGQPTADFINCQAWGKLAENVAKYTGKGLRVAVEGRIQTGSYEKDGQRVYTTDVIASNIEFVDWKEQKNSVKNINQFNGIQDEFIPTRDERIPF